MDDTQGIRVYRFINDDIDLMTLKRVATQKTVSSSTQVSSSFIAQQTGGLCLDFHPKEKNMYCFAQLDILSVLKTDRFTNALAHIMSNTSAPTRHTLGPSIESNGHLSLPQYSCRAQPTGQPECGIKTLKKRYSNFKADAYLYLT